VPPRPTAEHRLQVQNAATRALAEAGSLADAAPRVLSALGGPLGWELGAVWCVDRSSSRLRCTSVWHGESIDASAFTAACKRAAFPIGTGIPGRAWAEGGPIWVNDVAGLARSERVRDTARLGLHAAFAFPILLPSGVLGVMEFFSREVRRPDEPLLELMQSVGSQIAQFIERTHAEEAARTAEERFQALAASAVGLWQVNAAGQTVFMNASMRALLELDEDDELGGLTHDAFFAPGSLDRIENAEHGTTSEAELRGHRGGARHVVVSGAPLANSGTGDVLRTFIDVSEGRRAQERLAYVAHHDEVTGLPNRAMLMQHLEVALARAARTGDAVAVVCVDIDDFRLVNDSIGHASGDALLRETAARLRRVTRPADVVARFAADEFLILLADIEPASGTAGDDAHQRDSAQVSQAIAGQVRLALQAPFLVDGKEISIGASTGVAIASPDGADPEAFLRAARDDMMQSRDADRGRGPVAERPAKLELSFVTRLRRAVERDELVLHYQPVMDLDAGRMVGVEALVRWDDPEHGLIQPGDFIPVAERIGMIGSISQWVVHSACRQAHEWRKAGLDLCVGINLPPILWQPSMLRRLTRTIQTFGIAAGQLMIEITESAAMTDPDRTTRILRELHERGFGLAIDDFGTGYSSLSRLKQMPVTTIKIDRSFIRDLPDDGHSATMVAAIIGLARTLGLVPLAEGIETEDQLRFLTERGCPLGQGYHFSRPVPASEIAALHRQLSPGRRAA
jgi:diguanylate cyclase (GGDEF)-like protein